MERRVECTTFTEFIEILKDLLSEDLGVQRCRQVGDTVEWLLCNDTSKTDNLRSLQGVNSEVLGATEQRGVRESQCIVIVLPYKCLNTLNWQFFNELCGSEGATWGAFDNFRKQEFRRSIRLMRYTLGIEKEELLWLYQEAVAIEDTENEKRKRGC